MSCECPFLTTGDKIINGFKDPDISQETAQAMIILYQQILNTYGYEIFCSILSAENQNIRLCNFLGKDCSGCNLRISKSN